MSLNNNHICSKAIKYCLYSLLKKHIKTLTVLTLITPFLAIHANESLKGGSSNNISVIGIVFNDTNLNGTLDANEYGIPGVRLATITGLLIETDGYGRYHIPGNHNSWKHSRNFILKVDQSSLPVNSEIHTENPRVIRLYTGSLNKINFGISM